MNIQQTFAAYRNSQLRNEQSVQRIPPLAREKAATSRRQQPEDKITLSPKAREAMKAQQHARNFHKTSNGHEGRISALEKWMNKNLSGAEQKNEQLSAGTTRKLEYISTRITEALSTDSEGNPSRPNLTEEQRIRLQNIQQRIQQLLAPEEANEITVSTADDA
ncbi:hypothetical protein O4H49_07535 [Kiloniella laminariae]|uniref:Uncharacterized protein n=1 Tax=Kiloniella laminariae TaxID=454162 RepID=A0ABT4LHQ1_9PROT|nr:hypothetical protein [Kiloniella laminariae]MCZ4280625.1 hypothetical protein [Kiloniella laminariae]